MAMDIEKQLEMLWIAVQQMQATADMARKEAQGFREFAIAGMDSGT